MENQNLNLYKIVYTVKLEKHKKINTVYVEAIDSSWALMVVNLKSSIEHLTLGLEKENYSIKNYGAKVINK